MTTILGIKTNSREQTASRLQDIFTNYGCIIKTRLGLHKVFNNKCLSDGIILLEVIDDNEVSFLELSLCEIEGIEIQKMVFR